MQIRLGYYDLDTQELEIPEEIRKDKKARVRFWNVKFKRYEDLARFPNLYEVKVLSYPLDSLEPFTAVPNLRRLDICHLPKVQSLKPLAEMKKLEYLSLRTLPSWAGKKHTVKSFAPIARLTTLRELEFVGVAPQDRDLSPLYGLTKLKELLVSDYFPQEELARLAGRMPKKLRDRCLQPYLPFNVPCRKCKSNQVMLCGSDIRPKFICPDCKRKHFDKYTARFEAIVEEEEQRAKRLSRK